MVEYKILVPKLTCDLHQELLDFGQWPTENTKKSNFCKTKHEINIGEWIHLLTEIV